MKKLLLVLCCLLLAMPLVASADMYKWKDKNGKWQYSDVPPPGDVAYTKVVTDPAPTSSGAAGGANVSKDPEWKSRATQDAAQKKLEEDKLAEEARAREARCKQAKSVKATFEQGGRIVSVNENGERHYYGDQERAAIIQQSREVIETDCLE